VRLQLSNCRMKLTSWLVAYPGRWTWPDRPVRSPQRRPSRPSAECRTLVKPAALIYDQLCEHLESSLFFSAAGADLLTRRSAPAWPDVTVDLGGVVLAEAEGW
jgi:hypothetical protein